MVAVAFGRCRLLVMALALLAFSAISLLFAADNSDYDYPIKLKDGHNTLEDYQIHDQCMKQTDRSSIRTFGLEFLLLDNQFCEGGFYICYPGQLDGRYTRTGMVSDIPYRVKNQEGNVVAKYCEKKRSNYCKEHPDDCTAGEIGSVPWHGIWFKATNSGGNFSLDLRLSFTNPEGDTHFTFKMRHLLLRFVDKYNNLAGKAVNVHEDNRKFRVAFNYQAGGYGDDYIRDTFLNEVENGQLLKDHVCLWMLGLDVMPTMAENELHLFVYRENCCMMAAWFMRPTDLFDAKVPTIPEVVGNCKPNIPGPNVLNSTGEPNTHPGSNEPKLIPNFGKGKKVVWYNVMVTREENDTVQFHLLNNNTIILSVEISSDKFIFGPSDAKGQWDTEVITMEQLYPNPSVRPKKFLNQYTHFQVVLKMEYSFEFTYVEGGIVVQNNFWPDDWQTTNELTKPAVWLESQANIAVGAADVNDIGHVESSISTSMKLDKAMAQGSEIVLRAEVNPQAKRFEINLLHDAPEWHHYFGATLLRIQVKFENGNKNNVSYCAYSNQTWSNQGNWTTDDQDGPFKPGQAFECKLILYEIYEKTLRKGIRIVVLVNNKELGTFEGNLPLWTLNYIQVNGDMRLLKEPIVHYAEETTDVFKHELGHLLYEGDILCIKGKVQNNKKDINFFNIYLFHEANEYSEEIGDVVLEMKFMKNTITVSSYLHDSKKWNNYLTLNYNPIRPDAEFSIRIEVINEKYEIFINDEHIKLIDETEVSYQDKRIPSWAANWLTVYGASKVETVEKDGEKCAGQKLLPANILHLYSNNLLKIGEKITIEGKVSKNILFTEEVTVYFFREALDYHKIIGQTVMRARFGRGKITFNTYIPKNWTFKAAEEPSAQLKAPMKAKQKFEIEIKVINETAYQVSGDMLQEPMEYDTHNPFWAVQYIVVKGLEESKGSKMVRKDSKS